MNFFIRASNGWDIAKRSFNVLQDNKQLIVFPVLSGFFLFALLIPVVMVFTQEDAFILNHELALTQYLYIFAYYLINYFVIVIFNTGLAYCVSLSFKGEAYSVIDGFLFSIKRLHIILAWTIFASTIGTLLRLIHENIGFVGRLLAGYASTIFGIGSYFVVPVIVFENVGPATAFKRSVKIIRENWGNAAGVAFNFLFIQFIAVIFIAIVALTIGTVFGILPGIVIAVLGVLMLLAATSAARVVFVTAVYQNINGSPVAYFEPGFIDHVYVK